MKKLLSLYIGVFILFSLTFLLLFQLPIQNFQPVIFYRGLVYLVLTLILFLTVVFIFKFNKISKESLVAAILVSTSLNLSFFVIFPVTFERSVTMYLLNTLNKQSSECGGLDYSSLQKKLIDDYIVKNKSLDKRIAEQKVIGFIDYQTDCIRITPKAEKFLIFSDFIAKIYRLNLVN